MSDSRYQTEETYTCFLFCRQIVQIDLEITGRIFVSQDLVVTLELMDARKLQHWLQSWSDQTSQCISTNAPQSQPIENLCPKPVLHISALPLWSSPNLQHLLLFHPLFLVLLLCQYTSVLACRYLFHLCG